MKGMRSWALIRLINFYGMFVCVVLLLEGRRGGMLFA